jgi:hypothetical protein
MNKHLSMTARELHAIMATEGTRKSKAVSCRVMRPEVPKVVNVTTAVF